MANDDLIRLAVGRMGVDRGHSIHDQAVAQLFKQQIDGVEERMKSAFGGFTRIYSFFGAKDPDFRRNLKRVCPDTLCLPFAPEGSGHMARRYLAAIGAESDSIDIRMDLTADDRQVAQDLLNRTGLKTNGYVLLLPGSGGREKNWPAERFCELADLLRDHLQVAAIIGPAETEQKKILRDCGIVLLEGLELGTMAALAWCSRAFVGNDSGVSHLAACSGARGVVIFGPTNPEIWRPLGDVRVLKSQPIAALEVTEVRSALRDLMGV
jgi:heptosyltransferase-2